ncbi:ketoacyl-synt-domain-containing protein [Dichomitus squalens]|uniref:Ketoacyl-synt-domain-containing protein n=1 Tax=Dichomitus squalens TaxID=114155 RepID=A0A4Q9MKM3_9APHY|nr:ketoacyl-synt-domain-containing protein [Dichomitus squalens]
MSRICPPSSHNQSRSIAIVGMANTFPNAPNPEVLWDVLLSGQITVAEVPPERFSLSEQQEGDAESSRDPHTLRGNFIDQPDIFDNAFFHVSPREAQSMDPQQRLLLHVAYHALENAGYIPNATRSWNPETFGTFVGVATNDYVHNLRSNIDVYYSTGTLQSFLSGKIAYTFGFGGPALVLDTACSSSIVAIHQACRALQNGDCNAALAGGVNVITSPDMYLGLSRGHLLSETGQCRPWDASADGYGRSEGCGLFVLKRLDDAVADNDRILAVIRGAEVNQSGNARSITHPHIPTQVALFERLVASTGVHPNDISVAECHGTGTAAGDPAELEAVRKVFAVGRAPDNPLHITSVKANIGHAEAASGAASLAKLILMFREKMIPHHPSFERLNPQIPDLSVDNVRIDTTNVPWTSDGQRLALLNNFGASGSNAALILEEYVASPRPQDVSLRTGAVVGLACKSSAATEKMRDAYIAQLKASEGDATALHDFAYSATARRQLHPFRIAVGGTSTCEILQALRDAPVVQVLPAQRVVFVFSGQGSQYDGMAAELYRELELVSRIVDGCDRKLIEWGFVGILDVFRAPQPAQRSHDPQHIQATQVALFVLEYALAQLWISWGVRPVAVVSHSFGEFVALVVAGVMTLDDGLRLVATRARLVYEKCTPGETGMTGVHASTEQLEPLLATLSGLEICCYNGTSHNTVGGPLAELQQLESLCNDRGYQFRRLDIALAYHSAAMDPVLDDLREAVKGIKLKPPQIAVLSNVHGTLVYPGATIAYSADYFARHCREPARFSAGIVDFQARFCPSDIAAFIEVGPHPTTLSFLCNLQQEGAPLLLPSLRKNASDIGVLCSTLAKLYCTSVPVQWGKVFTNLAPEARLVDLPPYPFADTRFWTPYEERRSAVVAAAGSPNQQWDASSMDETSQASASEVSLDDLAELIQGHEVAGFSLCPASVYADLVLSGAKRELRRHSREMMEDVIDLVDVSFPAALVYVPDRPRRLLVNIDIDVSQKYAGSFSITSIDVHGGDAQTHCSGVLKRTTLSTRDSKFLCARGLIERETKRILAAPAAETFSTRTVYDLLFPQVVRYSETYRAIQAITVDGESLTAYAICRLPKAKRVRRPPQGSVVNSVFVDTLFHVAGFLVNFTSGMNCRDAFICSRVDRVKVLPDLIDPSASYGVYASAVRLDDAHVVVDVYAVAVESPEKAVVANLKRVHFRRVALTGFTKMLALTSDRPMDDALIADADVVSMISTAGRSPAPIEGDALHACVRRVISETSNITLADISPEAELSKLGIDSLMTWEIVARLRSLLPTSSRRLDPLLFANATTVDDLIRVVSDHCGTGDAPSAIAVRASLDSSITLNEESSWNEDSSGEPVSAKTIGPEIVKGLGSNAPDLPQLDLVENAGELVDRPEAIMSLESRSDIKPGSGGDVIYSIWRLQDPNRTLPPSSCGLLRTNVRIAPFLSLESRTGTTPLFLVHDGTGLIGGYSKLAPLGREVWAIRNHSFADTYAQYSVCDSERELNTLVNAYLAMLTRNFFDGELGLGGECLMGGWSFGGVVAFELAQSLLRMGINVKGLILIDAPAPQTSSPFPDALIDSVVERMDPAHRIAEHLKAQMKRATRTLVAHDPCLSTRNLRRIPAVYLRSQEGMDITLCDAEIDSRVQAFLNKENDTWTIPQWKTALGGEMEVLDIPGDHLSVFDQRNVDEVSEQLRKAIQILLST